MNSVQLELLAARGAAFTGATALMLPTTSVLASLSAQLLHRPCDQRLPISALLSHLLHNLHFATAAVQPDSSYRCALALSGPSAQRFSLRCGRAACASLSTATVRRSPQLGDTWSTALQSAFAPSVAQQLQQLGWAAVENALDAHSCRALRQELEVCM